MSNPQFLGWDFAEFREAEIRRIAAIPYEDTMNPAVLWVPPPPPPPPSPTPPPLPSPSPPPPPPPASSAEAIPVELAQASRVQYGKACVACRARKEKCNYDANSGEACL